jgi:hypothetical protein
MRSRRALRVVRVALASALLVLTAALALAGSANAESTTVIHFQPEGLPPLEAQLHKHEVHALTFHPTPAPGHIHVSMNDGKHYTVVYTTTAEQEHLIALARTDGTAVTVATVKTKSKATHHKLRYIAAGILIVVIVIVAAVLLVDRRRKLREEEAGGAPAPSASGDGSG